VEKSRNRGGSKVKSLRIFRTPLIGTFLLTKVGLDLFQQTVALAPNFGIGSNYGSLFLQSSGRRSLCNCREASSDTQGCKSGVRKTQNCFKICRKMPTEYPQSKVSLL